jgi:hypothetical protein
MFTQLIEKENRLKKAQDYAKSKGGECLSEEYINAALHLTWKCSEGHIWNASAKHVLFGSWCPKCNGKFSKEEGLEKAKQYASSKGGECLSTEYVNSNSKLTWRCSEGHIWDSSFGIISSNYWCKKCSDEANINKNGLIEAKKYAESRNGECLSNEYLGAKKELTWKCENNHIWKSKYVNVVLSNSWCPQCAKYFQSEHKVRNLFNYLFDTEFHSTRPSWNLNPITNKPLELDGYSEELKLAFEYQGQHHYEVGIHNNTLEDLEYIQFKDKVKKENCVKQGVELLIIDHKKKSNDEDIINYILDLLKEKNIQINKIIDINVLKDKFAQQTNHHKKYLEKAKNHAISKGGECLSTEYVNSESKLTWKCSNINHPTWEAIYRSIINTGRWCPLCAREISNKNLLLRNKKE